MSEPVIKAFMADRMRGEDGQLFWREHFTRDDLVRVANAAYEHAIDHGWPGGAVIVDRLTKGDVER